MDPNDDELLERSRDGDVDAYAELVRRHQDQALAAAYVILGDRHEAEDATQEAFTNAYRALDRFRAGAAFRPWLLRIVVNEARDLLTARQRRVDALSRAAGVVESTATRESAESSAFAEQRREGLLLALFELPETDRLVLTCRYFLDLSEAEVAELLGIARGTVKSRLSRALARLGPIVRDLGPLVVVPPLLEFPHLVAQNIASGGSAAHTVLAAPAPKVAPRLQHIATLGIATLAAAAIAGAVLLSRPPRAPASPAQPARVVVLGADLSDAERQEVASSFGAASSTETVSREELTDALSAQGQTPQTSDAALSSVQLVCQAPSSGLDVQTRNISRLTPAEYASALIVAGLYDGSVTVAAPTDQSVSGESALVGLMKAFPTCAGGSAPDPNRVQLAYEQLAVVSSLAGTDANMPPAARVLLDVLTAITAGQLRDATAIGSAIDTAAANEGVAISDTSRGQAIAYFGRLVGLDFGPYAHGLVVQTEGNSAVRIAPRN